MRLLDAISIHKAQKVIGEPPDRERSVASWRFPVPTCVQGINMIILSECIHLPCEIVTVLTVSMQENQRLSMPLLYEIVLYVSAVAFVQFAFNLVQRVEEPFRGDRSS